ncbi:MAG TPA: endospore germination permease, partial [Thermoanaerobacterales bacterium]|nr:endospore germination permease [Thermoanaerobacterales bacterium]
FTSPALLIKITGPAAWYVTLISMLTALLGFTFTYLLLKKHKGKNLIEIFEIVLGRYLGAIFSGVLVLWFIFAASILLREFIEVLRVYELPSSPTSFVMLTFVVGVGVICYFGLESITRFTKLLFPILFFGFILVIFISSSNYNYHHLFPAFGYGITKSIFNGIKRSAAYGEAMILAVFFHSLASIKRFRNASYIAIIISGLLNSLALLAYIMTFPYFTASRVLSLLYEMTKLIEYGRFFQRLDPIFFFIWNIGTFVTVTALFYTSVSIFCMIFRIKDIKPILIPFLIILFSGAMLPQDAAIIITGYVQASREYSWIIYYLLPLIVLIVSMFKGGKKETLENE